MVLNENDKEFVKKLFDSLDKDNNGKLTREEIKEGFFKLKIPSSEKDIESFLTNVDKDKDGSVSFKEFEDFTIENIKKLKIVFEELDTNKSGTLDIHEIEESIKKLNIPLYSEQELIRLFHRIDKNRDNQIDFNEWRELLVLLPNSNLQLIISFWKDAQILDAGFDNGGFIPPMVEKKEKASSLRNTITYMLAGSVAGFASRTSTAPLERVKIMCQLNHGKPISLISAFKACYKDGGIRGFFRGNLANIIKVSPESAVKFGTYEYVKKLFAENDCELTSAQRFISGSVAGVVSHTTLFPLEVVRLRLSAEVAGTYNGIFDCFKKIAISEKSIRPFYRGLGASITATIPHSGVNMMVYEFLKHKVIKMTGNEFPTAGQLLVCASTSSVCGQLVGYPFHVVKSRLITQGSSVNQEKYTGLFDGLTKIIKKEGPIGLYKGIVPSFMKSIPSHSITFIVYEGFKKAFDVNLKEKKHH
ncbi:hypothetical protein ACTFIW_012623 [Dictyostelium discoideum]